MRVQLEGVRVTVGGDRLECSTELISTGGFVVTAITVVADVGVQLLSSHVAGLQGPAAVTHMVSAAGVPRFEQHTVQLAGVTLARACLLDHAAQLRGLLAGEHMLEDVRVDIEERTLTDAQRVWGPSAAEAR
jgi:predicted NUDIX family NTP pyrophosphohydrolase